MARPLISVIAPVYGCTECLEALFDAVKVAFYDTDLDWELILVDDRGPDDPWPLIQELSARDPRVRGVRLTRNHGQYLAIWAGFAEARGDWVAVLDCDLQDDPAVLPKLYETARERGVEAVVVDRGSWSDSAWRRSASRVFHRLVRLLAGLEMDNNTGNFGLYSRRMTDILLSFEDREVFLPTMVLLTGLSRTNYRQDRTSRVVGKSAYSLRRLIRVAIAVIIRFSDRPLKLSIVVGVAISTLSALMSLVVLVAWSMNAFHESPGWTSLILSIWFLSGLILAVLGVHGLYIGRIFSEVRKRPRILVEQMTKSPPP